MKKSLICTAVLSSMLIFAGCGSDNESSNNNNQGSVDNNDSTSLTQEQKDEIVAIADETSSVTLKEGLLSGVVDTLVYGTDEANEDVECTSGNYTNVGGVITFNNCEGLFNAYTGLGQFHSLKANGRVMIINGAYKYQNLELFDPTTDESKTVTGILEMSGDEMSSVISIQSIAVKATERRGTAFADVNYTLENYLLNYDRKGTSELALAVKGTLSVDNSAVGNYTVEFKTTQPLMVQIDADDEIASYPYAGEMTVNDLDKRSVTTFTANTDKKTARYSITANGEKIAEGTKPWEDVLGFN